MGAEMKELLEAFKALERLGASWEARRVSKKFLFDTIECVTLVQTDKGVIRGFVEVQRWDTYCRAKVEVVCYLGGRLEIDGETRKFKHAKHPREKTVKIFEYEKVVLYHYSKIFGIGLGFKPADAVPAEHRYLVSFADSLVIKFDVAQKDAEKKKLEATEERRQENERVARRILFG